MAQNKKSFVLYADLLHTVKQLPKKTQAELFLTILEYVNDLNPDPKDRLLKVAFEPIKQQLKRDLKDWEDERKKRSEAGKRGMDKRWHSITKDKSVSETITPITPITDNVTVNVNDNVTVVDKANNLFFEMFRRAAGSHITDKELEHEIGRFRNKYPNIHPNQAGAIINTWISNIGRDPKKEKSKENASRLQKTINAIEGK